MSSAGNSRPGKCNQIERKIITMGFHGLVAHISFSYRPGFLARIDFAGAVDVIGGWYGKMNYDRLNLSKRNAKRQCPACHEGHGGFGRGTCAQKPRLKKLACQVEASARPYRVQLAGCRDELESGGWCR